MSNFSSCEGEPDIRMKPQESPGNGWATASLVFGCLVILFSVFAGLIAIVCGVIALVKVGSSTERPPKGKGKAIAGISLGVLSFPLVVVPAFQKLREVTARLESQSNLKQIGLAMHNYASDFRRFPPASFVGRDFTPAEKGKGLSWRVAILPYLEEQELFNQFHLDEPWDSEHNKSLLKYAPRTYRNPTDPEGTIETPYRVFVGNGALFDWGKPGPTFGQITDGISNTIMIVEATDTVPWTKPDELEFNPQGPLPPLGLKRGEGWLAREPSVLEAGLADSSVRSLYKDMSSQRLRALITYAGGEPFTEE